LERINKEKVHLSQLLGTLQSRVEDYIETEQFKKAFVKIKKREKDIEVAIKESNKKINYSIREFNKFSNNFETKNKHLIKNFELFIKEFKEIVIEKVKSSEEQILQAYVQMAIKAIAFKMLTVSFLQSELKIKKQKIQKYLISLISSGKLKGVYDPRLGIYYEDPKALEQINEEELEVMNKMNFRLQRIMSRMKIFVGQYGRILSFFASLFAISYYIFMMTGQNPSIFIIALIIAFILLTYLLFKKKKEEKIS
jgi:LPXTG-motif cell wall-anchored protein